MFFSDGAQGRSTGVKAFVKTRQASCRAGVRAHSNVVTVCLQAQAVQAALSGGGVDGNRRASAAAWMSFRLTSIPCMHRTLVRSCPFTEFAGSAGVGANAAHSERTAEVGRVQPCGAAGGRLKQNPAVDKFNSPGRPRGYPAARVSMTRSGRGGTGPALLLVF